MNNITNYLVTSAGALTIKDVLLNFLVAAIISAVIYLSLHLQHTAVQNKVYLRLCNLSKQFQDCY